MRCLFKAAVLLAPALAAAFIVPADGGPEGHSFAVVAPEFPPSPDGQRELLPFRLDVLPSEEACGFGNVTVNAQVLPQTWNGDVGTGSGPITTARQSVVMASWTFNCVKVNGQPDAQLLKFAIDVADGQRMEGVGFSTLFRQTGFTEVINMETDLSLPEKVVANPDPASLQPVVITYESFEAPLFDVEQELDELNWLRAQKKELEYLIWAKEQAIAEHDPSHLNHFIQDCDSLKCLAKAVVGKARKAASKVLHKIHSHHGDKHDDGDEEEEFGHFQKGHFKFPHWPKKPKHGKHGNHTCGPPKHIKFGNHTHGNHTFPPHFRFPHHRPLPVCRYPPPPPRKGGPHRRPPHHPPPPPGAHPHPPPPSEPHGGFPEDGDMPPPPPPPPGHHDFPHDGPPKGHHGGPDDDMRPPFERPPFDGPHGPPGHDEPDFDHPPPPPPGPKGPEGHDEPDFDHPPPPPPGPKGPEIHVELDFGRPPPGFEPEAPFQIDDISGPPGPPGRRPPFDGPRPHRNRLGKAFHVVKFVVIGVLLSLFVIALHRRGCNPKKRAERRARREERRRRRAFRHAAHRHAVSRFFARISGHGTDEDDDDYEEKRRALLASAAEDGMSTTMSEEITEFRNAADVVEDMISASSSSSESRAQPIPIPTPASEDRPLLREDDIGSQVGDGEELPAYEDNDGSEMSSVVADGFRYTPGSTEYSPSHSPAGSVCDIMGPDTKQ